MLSDGMGEIEDGREILGVLLASLFFVQKVTPSIKDGALRRVTIQTNTPELFYKEYNR